MTTWYDPAPSGQHPRERAAYRSIPLVSGMLNGQSTHAHESPTV
ncbi:hypothetical protein [Granulicella sibirica]|uniref:Uncharacterized protein n=1 Tax=Granulicella sibirica TaxID=2479048 RepID=A0A4V1L6B0_9BACT|nr:hypothetical protein [Granulicella sibirica]RXH58634.1 hypothetical protein GRAN_1944 [Granulicella sibirica]